MIGVLPLSATLGGLILLILVLRALYVLRAERDTRPGAPPGTGHHIVRSEYCSGGGGGGSSTEYKIPKDTQEYARLFVPKTQDKDL